MGRTKATKRRASLALQARWSNQIGSNDSSTETAEHPAKKTKGLGGRPILNFSHVKDKSKKRIEVWEFLVNVAGNVAEVDKLIIEVCRCYLPDMYEKFHNWIRSTLANYSLITYCHV